MFVLFHQQTALQEDYTQNKLYRKHPEQSTLVSGKFTLTVEMFNLLHSNKTNHVMLCVAPNPHTEEAVFPEQEESKLSQALYIGMHRQCLYNQQEGKMLPVTQLTEVQFWRESAEMAQQPFIPRNLTYSDTF